MVSPFVGTSWWEALALEQAGIQLTQAQRWSVPLGRGNEARVAVLFHPKSQALLLCIFIERIPHVLFQLLRRL